MKLFILTCINEQKQIVSQSGHTTLAEASHKMSDEYVREKNDIDEESLNVFECGLGVMSAELSYGENNEYNWIIKEIEV